MGSKPQTRFQDDTSVVVLILLCFDVEFLCFLHLMHIFIHLVKSV